MFSVSIEGKQVRVAVAGKLSRDEAADMAGEVEDMLEDAGAECSEVYVDIGAVEYLSSSGLGALVRMFRAARTGGREMVVLCVRPEIRSLIELAGIDRLMKIVDRREMDTH